MPVLPIYTYGAAVLRKRAHLVKEVNDEIIRLMMDMHDTMLAASGIGLAANQVGDLNRIILVDLSGMEEMKDFKPLILINPEIISREGAWTMEEGCLSIPDVRDEVERAESIRIKYRNTGFREVEMEASELLGRVILHEIDHLNGVLFTDHLASARRKLHAQRLRQIERGDIEVGYPIVTAGVTV